MSAHLCASSASSASSASNTPKQNTLEGSMRSNLNRAPHRRTLSDSLTTCTSTRSVTHINFDDDEKKEIKELLDSTLSFRETLDLTSKKKKIAFGVLSLFVLPLIAAVGYYGYKAYHQNRSLRLLNNPTDLARSIELLGDSNPSLSLKDAMTGERNHSADTQTRSSTEQAKERKKLDVNLTKQGKLGHEWIEAILAVSETQQYSNEERCLLVAVAIDRLKAQFDRKNPEIYVDRSTQFIKNEVEERVQEQKRVKNYLAQLDQAQDTNDIETVAGIVEDIINTEYSNLVSKHPKLKEKLKQVAETLLSSSTEQTSNSIGEAEALFKKMADESTGEKALQDVMNLHETHKKFDKSLLFDKAVSTQEALLDELKAKEIELTNKLKQAVETAKGMPGKLVSNRKKLQEIATRTAQARELRENLVKLHIKLSDNVNAPAASETPEQEALRLAIALLGPEGSYGAPNVFYNYLVALGEQYEELPILGTSMDANEIITKYFEPQQQGDPSFRKFNDKIDDLRKEMEDVRTRLAVNVADGGDSGASGGAAPGAAAVAAAIPPLLPLAGGNAGGSDPAAAPAAPENAGGVFQPQPGGSGLGTPVGGSDDRKPSATPTQPPAAVPFNLGGNYSSLGGAAANENNGE